MGLVLIVLDSAGISAADRYCYVIDRYIIFLPIYPLLLAAELQLAGKSRSLAGILLKLAGKCNSLAGISLKSAGKGWLCCSCKAEI
ncbi:hypothetical protein [Cytobacillus firmus]|uniref:hypothetical protein n=1 Tax=Cytobacillus firmus TaxID=1399 RepID=UPI001C969002|nr:hypothetical protein [Cytobacillus firmus]MBY6051785.1 hypothetical protein [Cytobacillus firmus]